MSITMQTWWSICFCGCLLFGVAAAVPAVASTNVASRHIQYGFTLQNTRGELLPLAEVWIFGPAARTSSQLCSKIRSSHPHQITADSIGNQVLHFAFTNLPPYGVKIITVEADVELIDSPGDSIEATADVSAWLKPERMVEIDDPEFMRLSPAFSGANTISKAEAVFQWVLKNMQNGGYSARDRGALHALRSKKGDCTEFMYLFVALCRKAGIPARGLAGDVCPKNMIVHPADYHNWAEFYDGGAWHLVDPFRKLFMPRRAGYVATRIIGGSENPAGDPGRFRYSGAGLKVEMN